jgi:hypothetical protein
MQNPGRINLRLRTMGGKVWWNDLDARCGYRLQQHKLRQHHFRILDSENIRCWWDTCSREKALAAMEELVGGAYPPANPVEHLAASAAAPVRHALDEVRVGFVQHDVPAMVQTLHAGIAKVVEQEMPKAVATVQAGLTQLLEADGAVGKLFSQAMDHSMRLSAMLLVGQLMVALVALGLGKGSSDGATFWSTFRFVYGAFGLALAALTIGRVWAKWNTTVAWCREKLPPQLHEQVQGLIVERGLQLAMPVVMALFAAGGLFLAVAQALGR